MPAPEVKAPPVAGRRPSDIVIVGERDDSENYTYEPINQAPWRIADHRRRFGRLPNSVRRLIAARATAIDADRSPIIASHFGLVTRQEIDSQLAAFGLAPKMGVLAND